MAGSLDKKGLDGLKDVLRKNGISPSFHRLKIYEFLMSTRIHPTVDTLYGSIVLQIPTLSKTTVYNTLKTFMEKGIVHPVTIEDNEVRYDADTSPHGHFKCTKCGTLYDLDLKALGLGHDLAGDRTAEGHRITEQQFYFKGICKKCHRR